MPPINHNDPPSHSRPADESAALRDLFYLIDRPAVSASVMSKWQDVAELMATLMGVTAAAVMRSHQMAEIEVIATNSRPENPLAMGSRMKIAQDLYCERVLRTRALFAVEDAANDPAWQSDIPLGMRSYLGVPLLWPDGEVFGSMCLMDTRPRAFSEPARRLLDHFRAALEMDLRLLVEIEHSRLIQTQLAEAQRMARLGSWTWDTSTDRLHASDELYRIMGLARGHSLSLAEYLACIHPDDRAQVMDPELYLSPSPKARTLTFRILRPDGEERVLRQQVAQVDDAHLPLRLQGTVQDITEEVAAEQRQRQAAVEEERSRLLARFVRDLAHEIKTPLSVIETSMYIIERSPDEQRRRDHMGRIRVQTQTIAGQLDTFTQLVRLDVPGVLRRGPARVDALLRDVAAVARQRHAGRDVALHLALDDCPLSLIYESELADAMQHLIDNGLRYTPDGGSVTVTLRCEPDLLSISVRDTGIGMNEEVLARAFDHFYRGDAARTTRGLGMGLPIVRKVVQLHDGHIAVESMPGVGSTFTLTLPLVLPTGNRLD